MLLNDLPGNGTTNSPPAGVIPIPYSPSESTAGFRVAIFDGNNSQTPVGYATPVGSGFPGLYQYTFTTPLADGLHNITAAVQMIDPATPTETGFGGLSTALAITVDTVPPPVFFGSSANGYDGLAAASDSGVQGYPATNVDRVTNDTTPTFWGTAEADAIVRVYAVGNRGRRVAGPNDGHSAGRHQRRPRRPVEPDLDRGPQQPGLLPARRHAATCWSRPRTWPATSRPPAP